MSQSYRCMRVDLFGIFIKVLLAYIGMYHSLICTSFLTQICQQQYIGYVYRLTCQIKGSGTAFETI